MFGKRKGTNRKFYNKQLKHMGLSRKQGRKMLKKQRKGYKY